MIVVTDQGLRSYMPHAQQRLAHCVFEHVYFSRPDSVVFGRSVNDVRMAFGRQLARESAVPADVVVPIPDSGVCAALGFAEEAHIPFRMGLIRNHYVGRTFIEPQQSIRHFGVRVKLNPVRDLLKGRRVVLLDDSIVRGTTSRKIVKMVRAAGATEVHMRISCPPTISPCFYGVDTPRRSELIAATHSLEEVRKYLGADSLSYLSLEGMLDSVGESRDAYCTSCYTGHYPVAFPRDREQLPATRAQAATGAEPGRRQRDGRPDGSGSTVTTARRRGRSAACAGRATRIVGSRNPERELGACERIAP